MATENLMRFVLIVSLVGLAGIAIAACGGDDESLPSDVVLVMTDNVFDTTSFTVKAGEEISITVKNEGTTSHNMHVLSETFEGQAFSSAQVVNPGNEDTFTAIFTKAGTVAFQCDFHLPGMGGAITIES